MTASRLHHALFSLALALGILGSGTLVASAPAVVTRPRITSLTVALEDGRSYALTAQQLADPKGGALFWGDWAVANLLVPHYIFNRTTDVSAETVLRLWCFPGPSGQRPAFLVKTGDGPVNPLDPGPADLPRFDFSPRTQVTAITVGYADGRFLSLNKLALRDRRSGVLVWNDHAVANLFIPFYLAAPNLPTHPEDVLDTWGSPAPTLGRTALAAQTTELPGFLIKPMCIPGYSNVESAQ
jgi:hypothetical protein